MSATIEHDTGAAPPPSPRIIDPSVDEEWPTGVPAGIRHYLSALHGNGPAALAGNASGVRGEIVRVSDRVLPVLVSDGKPGKASILSPIGHHVLYPIEEIGRRTRHFGQRGVAALASPLLALFRAAALDRAVFVNHWLLSGAPPPDLPETAWPDLFAFLAARHPRHAIVVQDVKPALEPGLAQALAAAGAIAVPTRSVAIFDAAMPLDGGRYKKTRNKIARALAALKDAEADRLPSDLARAHPQTLAALYRHSNVDRHSMLNPAYTAAFFKTALDAEEFRIQAWRAPGAGDDRIAAFNLQRVDGRTIHWSTFGTEPGDALQNSRYYERVAATDLAMAMEHGLLLDWGAGALDYKRFRGARQVAQVEMVHVAHLPPLQRAAWHLLAALRAMRARKVGLGAEG
jgi:hypothetical protein